MIQHISIRVPWHDHGWDGSICQDPCGNTSCLRLNAISEGKDEMAEQAICGQCILGHEKYIPCLSEGVAFMSNRSYVIKSEHPYVKYGYEEYQHLLPTENVYPPFSLPARPFRWLLKSSMHDINQKYNLCIDEEQENNWHRGKSWLQFGDNHQAVFDYFYKDVIPDKSLCLIYAKQVPFVEDVGRVIIGIGHIKNISMPVEYKRKSKTGLRSMLWETHISHSIRDNHADGFVFPFEKLQIYAEKNPEFDIRSVCVLAPSDAFEEFSYATEHVSYDAVIEVLLSCRKAFLIINEILDEDYSNVLNWIDARLNEVWDERGAFPGLGSMLCSLKVKYGVLVAKEIIDQSRNKDVWDTVDRMFAAPKDVLSPSLASNIDNTICKVWNQLTNERKQLFKLLSRFDLTIAQADALFQNDIRLGERILLTDREIIENPYLLYERTRLKRDELAISVKRIDRAVFPVESVRRQYPLCEPSAIESDNDIRRVRALAVYVLEQSAMEGNTILPVNQLMEGLRNLPLQPECPLSIDHLSVIEDEMKEEIITKYQKDGGKYYKLQRYEDFSHEIERKVKKKLKAERLIINADWSGILDQYLKDMNIPDHPDPEKEARIRREKTAALKELAESRISVLVGDAGTGKTTVLAALCSHPDIITGGVLLLAPTGKATVRLLESMGSYGRSFDAYNVAQFLSRPEISGFDFDDMRYMLPRANPDKKYETVIIDESSMLTEDMLGSLLKAVGGAKRIILVGDPNQLPPIGAGRPFIDLIRMIKPRFGNKVPRVQNGYCELCENCRQAAKGQRLDVEFAKQFTDQPVGTDRNIVTEILNGKSGNVRIVRWDGKDDLHEKLIRVLEEEFGINDQESFDNSLGGIRKYGFSYFNSGCAENVDKWQILAPVKNMPQGVLTLNHYIHSKFRAEGLFHAGKSRNKRIASPWGHESIIYGDKVINIRNMRKKGFPKDTCRNYIANGEIGIACGDWNKTRKWDDDSMRVEFSSQKGFYYYYGANNFDEELGTNDLELAYALTVHKAQGSQFDTVVFVLADPCKILSRELLYTALTRQKEKVVILYNGDPHKLLDYAHPGFSENAKRFTDLFTGMQLPDQTEYKPNIVKAGDSFFEESLIHRTTRGELVRSKSEVIIADHLYSNGISYDYEPAVTIGERRFRPDFIAYDPDDDSIFWYWEHVGMPNDPCYMSRWREKLAYYNAHGICEKKNLIITSDDENGGLDSKEIDDLIKSIFDV